MFSAHNKPSINDDYIISRVSSRGSLAAQSVFAKAATESFRSHLNIFPSKSSDESIDTSCFCKSHRLVDRSCYLGCVNMTHPSITLPRQVEWGWGRRMLRYWRWMGDLPNSIHCTRRNFQSHYEVSESVPGSRVQSQTFRLNLTFLHFVLYKDGAAPRVSQFPALEVVRWKLGEAWWGHSPGISWTYTKRDLHLQ